MEPVAPDWRSIGAPPAQPGVQPGSGRALAALPARQLALLAGGFVAALVLGAMATLLVMPTPGGVLVDAQDAAVITLDAGEPPRDASTRGVDAVTLAQPAALVVDVEGAVARPGLVHVPAGGRVADALELAGGFGPTVDLAAAATTLNLAQEVTDGLTIVVPAMGDTPVGATGGAADPVGAAAGGVVDLNRASEAELDALPGVGPATIAKIVAARAEAPFQSVDELRSRGIVGEAAMTKLRDLVGVGR
ncbi:MAG: helix-hairpin-helix domain-containing protein [Chloroflexota bacterium]